MTKSEAAMSWMESKANDNSHGYNQRYRWGEKGDYDCSAAVVRARENAGVPGDQTGKEFLIRPYRNYPWDCVLRYVGEETSGETGTTSISVENNEGGKVTVTASMLILKIGMTETAVEIWQKILSIAGYEVMIDGSFGPDTEERTRQFELSGGIIDDPHEVGPAAWKAGLELLKAAKSF